MKGIRTAVIIAIFIFVHATGLSAAGITHSARLGLSSIWGETSNNTFFREGASRLEWPMNLQLVGTAYTIDFFDVVEVVLGMHASPWISIGKPMRDYDWINESLSGLPRRAAHEGVDIYSESIVDSKIYSYDGTIRFFPLKYQFASLGMLLSYQNRELDFRAFDTNQTGFGSWQDQTTGVSGPTSTYSVEYDIIQTGLSWRVHAGDSLKVTVDTSYIPYVRALDEDNHIRRFRISRTKCTGDGRQLSLSMMFRLNKKWHISSSCSKLDIDTDGHQKQFWYGNDPASNGYDDTGQVLTGIDAEIEQDSFHAGVSIGFDL